MEQATLRFGYNKGSSQIPNRETLINTLAPATVNDNITAGLSWKFKEMGEISAAYMHGFRKTNRDPMTDFFGVGSRISIIQHTLDVSWAKDF